jgi:hypothetical protein
MADASPFWALNGRFRLCWSRRLGEIERERDGERGELWPFVPFWCSIWATSLPSVFDGERVVLIVSPDGNGIVLGT